MNQASTPGAGAAQSLAQLLYAWLLDWGARLGFAVLVLGFALYVFGVLSPHVPLDQLPGLWNQPAARYLQATSTPTGWGWLALVHEGDLLNLVGIALLAGCSLPPLLGAAWLYLRQRDWPMAAICTLVVAVIVLAASGVLTGGH
ncbi:MAG: hypothetical protein ACRC2B_00670 [Rubrivivax sp.]